MSKPKVFVTQANMVRDTATGGWIPKFDISPAQAYGSIVYIFGAGQMGVMDDEVETEAINERLAELKFNPATDYLLNTGDMGLGIRASHCMRDRGGCRYLKWDNKFRKYHVCSIITGEKIDER